MCSCTYFRFVAEWKGFYNALFYKDALRRNALPAYLLACPPWRAPWTRPPMVTRIPPQDQAGPAGAALLSIHVALRDPTSVKHLSHVFAP